LRFRHALGLQYRSRPCLSFPDCAFEKINPGTEHLVLLAAAHLMEVLYIFA
jgi:hypothetical protein